ncbi:MAG TPA: UDP-N-acetylmuramoyl-tripeptide--D-alanyl-D-alanine ligase [Candidatus Binatia bacterium]|jgi:UDP-N-acetylmuramoyl-tripeptide--D-alanyl-D-alanine ligase
MWTVEQILTATGGKVVREGKQSRFGEIVTDSKSAKKDSVFVALKGARFDGHRFLGDAARRGAACLLVHKRPAPSRLGDATVIQVRDTLEALGGLARYRREAVAPTVLAITGSNGKTTTKEMLAAILESASLGGEPLAGKILKTEGNLNNLVGLPQTLLRLQGHEKVAVVEMGTSVPGEIARLCRIGKPDIGLITSVAPAHLSGLSTVAGVAREKGAMFRGLNSRGIAIVNVDDPWTRRLGAKFKGTKITYGKNGDVRGEDWKFLGAEGTEFTLCAGAGRQRVRLKVAGEHNLSNALGAAAMAYGLGVEIEAMRAGLEAVRPYPMRMAIERWGDVGVINDAYNANPASMEAALKTLGQIETKGKKIAILGDMLELGREARERHVALGRQAAEYGIDRLYVLGRQARAVARGARGAGMEKKLVVIGKSHRQIAALIRKRALPGDWLLFKGSRGMKMERVLAALKETGV